MGEMEWNFHGEAKIERMESEEICSMPGFNLYSAAFEMKSCMHFCQNLGGSRVPPVTSSLQLERVGSFLSKTDLKSQYGIWISIHDEEKEGKWRDFYNHQGLNFTPPWFGNEPNGGTSENCASTWENRLYDIVTCKWPNTVCLCERRPSFHMRLRGPCAILPAYEQPFQLSYAATCWALGFYN